MTLMTQKQAAAWVPSALRNINKPRQKPRKQAIKETQIKVLNDAIVSLRDDMRAYKTEEQRKGHYLAISKLSQFRDEL